MMKQIKNMDSAYLSKDEIKEFADWVRNGKQEEHEDSREPDGLCSHHQAISAEHTLMVSRTQFKNLGDNFSEKNDSCSGYNNGHKPTRKLQRELCLTRFEPAQAEW